MVELGRSVRQPPNVAQNGPLDLRRLRRRQGQDRLFESDALIADARQAHSGGMAHDKQSAGVAGMPKNPVERERVGTP